MILMLKLPVTFETEWLIWKLVAVLVIVKVAASQVVSAGPCPAWLPKTAIDPATESEDLQRAAIIVGGQLKSSSCSNPLTQMVKAPKFAMLGMSVGVSVIGIVKKIGSLLFMAVARFS